MTFVLDSSVTLPLAFVDPNPYAEFVLERLSTEGAIVPWVWPLEVTNGILLGERTGRLDTAAAARFLNRLRTLDVGIDLTEAGRVFTVILDLARAQSLTSYDAAYLELARRDGIPLATADRALRAAAQRIGVALIEMPQATQGTEG